MRKWMGKSTCSVGVKARASLGSRLQRHTLLRAYDGFSETVCNTRNATLISSNADQCDRPLCGIIRREETEKIWGFWQDAGGKESCATTRHVPLPRTNQTRSRRSKPRVKYLK